MNINRSLVRRHRWLRKAAIVVAVLAAVGLEATPAMALTQSPQATSAPALNPRSYNIMRNAQLNQLCLDIDAPTHLAQLWSCHHPVTANQQYIVPTPAGPAGIMIQSQLGNLCLSEERPFQDEVRTCEPATDTAQRWTLNHDTGEIVTNANGDGGTCLTAVGDFNGARVINAPCNGSIAQRWFF